jgi:hypothetical protein
MTPGSRLLRSMNLLTVMTLLQVYMASSLLIIVGGTFDHLHAGHKILLSITAWTAVQKVICGVTGM